MSDAPDKDQQTEAPTQKRKDDAIKEGDVLASKELAAAVMMIAATAWLMALGTWFFSASKTLLKGGLSLDLSDPDHFDPLDALLWPLAQVAMPFAGLLLLTLIAAFAAPAMLGSFGMRGKAMAPKGSRINPLAGLKRIFGTQGLIELFKATAKVCVLGYAGYWIISGEIASLPGLAAADPAVAVGMIGQKILFTIALLTAGLTLIAFVDVPIQWFQRNRKLRMTKQQLKDELRQSDGAPELKQAIRARQQEVMMSSARKGMADANVVLTNPTHFAVALRYRPGSDAAPVVVARGRGEVALAIRAMAAERNVATLEYPQLTRAIYFTTRTGKAVSEDLYVAVAAILAFVFRLESVSGEDVPRPHVEVPASKRFDQDGRRTA
ncbi:flagellar biosynthesis protein FlhB [Sphingorhabdus sp.]|uniref:EscU/YscU/HrcU family type III secretion system export apparatus switch protein n=1 Tax=Sphingorhabdus sp. TaxID=1902408 RepID=UPI00391CC565